MTVAQLHPVVVVAVKVFMCFLGDTEAAHLDLRPDSRTLAKTL